MKKWNKKEDKILKSNYSKLSINQILQLLPGRTKNAITTRAQAIGVTEKMDLWNKEEIKILEKNYGKLTVKDLMKILPGRSKNAIMQYAFQLGLTGSMGKPRQYEENERKTCTVNIEKKKIKKLFKKLNTESIQKAFEEAVNCIIDD